MDYAERNIKTLISLRSNFPLLSCCFSKEFACNILCGNEYQFQHLMCSDHNILQLEANKKIKVLLTTFCCSGLMRGSQVSRVVFHVRTTT